MSVKLGNIAINKLYLGALEINKAYLGSELVYSGEDLTSFIIQVKTDNVGTSLDNQFTIPTTTGVYDYEVRTSDGQVISNNTGDTTITFPSAGTYDVSISGTFPQIYFNNGGDKDKLTDIKQWGDIAWLSMKNAFYGCRGLRTVTVTDTPNLSGAIDLGGIFRGINQPFTINLSLWDVSTISNFSSFALFSSKCIFTGIKDWDMSSATNVSSMFRGVEVYDEDLSGWDISNITTYTSFMLASGGLSTPNYDATLISWAAQSPSLNESISFGGSQYTFGGAAEAARNTLINTYGWTITDGGGI